VEAPRLHELQLQTLRLIRDATAAGLIRWRQSEHDRDWYHTESDLIATYIQFRFPSYNDDIGSDRDYVRVGEDRFMIGTPGWCLVLEILAAGFPGWRNHLEALLAERALEVKKLSAALEAFGASRQREGAP
jgi:hypothetical protein